MGCICGKALVKSSIERVVEQKNPHVEVESWNSSVQLKDPLQETSNESDRIIINQPAVQAIIIEKKLRCYLIRVKGEEFSSFYVFSAEMPSDFERSHANEWHQMLTSHLKQSRISLKPLKSDNAFINTDWDFSMNIDLTKKLLQLPPRQWINEQIYLINQSLCKGKDPGASLKRKTIQLKHQFEWFVWAVANFYYSSLGRRKKSRVNEFERLAGCVSDLPQRIEVWLEGFIYKFVKFKLVYRSSSEAKYLKSELKATKLLYLESLSSFNGLVFPLITNASISPFYLFAVPVYPNAYLQPCNRLHLDLFGKSNYPIPNTSLFKLKVEEDIYLIYNTSEFLTPETRRTSIILFKSADNSKVFLENLYQESVTKVQICKILYGEARDRVKVEQKVVEYFGWSCCVFWDTRNHVESKHEFSAFFGGISGDFVVFFTEKKLRFRRQCGEETTEEFKTRVRDTVNCLETIESINSQSALIELLHRKGLKGAHQWVIYSKCRSDRTSMLLEASLLSRSVKKIIFTHMAEQSQGKPSGFVKMVTEMAEALFKPDTKKLEPYLTLCFAMFLDRLWSVEDVILMNSGNSDISSSRIIDPLPVKVHSTDFFLSNEIVYKVLNAGQTRPRCFLKSLEYHLNIKFTEKLLTFASLDPNAFLLKTPSIQVSDIINLSTVIKSVTSLKEDSYILYLVLADKPANSENSVLSINESQILLMQKESEFASLDILLPADLYSNSSRLFKETYSLQSLAFLEEWASVHESFYKDQLTPGGQESVIIEIYLHVIYLYIAHEKNFEAALSVLPKIFSIIENSYYIEADLIACYYLWAGICQEAKNPAGAEQCFISALIILTRIFSDPRAKDVIGVPWQMAAAWKLSKIARDDKRILDAQLAEEHFDSVQMNSMEFKQKSQKRYNKKYAKQQASIYKNPFEDTQAPLGDEILAWIWSTSLSMYSSSTIWSQAEVKEYIKLTQIGNMPSQIINTSGASTPSSCKDTKRIMQQNSLSQALLLTSCALNPESAKGLIYIWGSDSDGQLGLGIEEEGSSILMYPRLLTCLKDFIITEISAGALHCIAVSESGLCFAWGNNEYFQLGLGGDLPKFVTTPVQIRATAGISSAACGYQHSVLLSHTGQVFTMGSGDGGVLGHSNTQSVKFPKMLLSIKTVRICKIKAGGYHNVVLSEQGHVYVWGRGDGGQLGLEHEEIGKGLTEAFVDSPVKLLGVFTDEKISQIACGEAHNLALTGNGRVFAWGWGSNGQLGNGYREEDFEESGNLLSIQYTPSPILSFSSKVIQISAGGLFSMFLTEEHEVFICGANDKKQLGLELEMRDIAIPTRIESFVGYPVDKIECGESHCVAVAEKIVWAWGNHLDHRLGLGELSTGGMPRPLQTLTNAEILKVACGRTHTMAILGKAQVCPNRPYDQTLNWKLELC